ncbi:MAG TPA: hypothetical protein VI300_18915 [Solirubrobacter sp.]
MKKYLAIAAAGGALALGVPAAFAATQSPSAGTTPVQSATPTPTQTAPDRDHDGHLCPDEGRNGGGADNQGSAAPAPSAPSATPDV